MKSVWARTICRLLVVLMVWTPYQIAQAGMIGTDQVATASSQSERNAVLGFVTFPVGVTGGVLVGALTGGGALSFGSAIALFAAFGLAVQNGMLLIDRLRELALEGGGELGPELIVRGARERLVPTLTTALAAGTSTAVDPACRSPSSAKSAVNGTARPPGPVVTRCATSPARPWDPRSTSPSLTTAQPRPWSR